MTEEEKNEEVKKIKTYKIILPEMELKTERFLNNLDKVRIEKALDVKLIDENEIQKYKKDFDFFNRVVKKR